MNEVARPLACAGAVCVAFVLYLRDANSGHTRFITGIYAGALLAYLGVDLVLMGQRPRFEGASILFVPLGVLLAAPWREALAALPLALGVARLGCLASDCCYASPWNALPELVGWVALHVGARRWPRHATPIVLCGFGAIRLLTLPLRRQPTIEPFVDPAWIALAWVAAGALLRNRIGSAEGAREWFTERTEPLLRSLVAMLVVWLLFPMAAELFGDPASAILTGSLAALVLVVALRRPLAPRITRASLVVLAGSLLVGIVIASLIGVGLRQLGLAATAHPNGAIGSAGGFAVVVLAPVFEELLYRERLLGVLRELWGWLPALVLSSALFALGHMDPAVMPIAFAGGLACGGVMLRTGSLAAVIGMHAGWNLGVIAAR